MGITENSVDQFYKDGISVFENWLGEDKLDKLNNELDYYFDDYSLNGSVRSQYFDETCQIFDHTHLLSSLNFHELLLDLVDDWKNIYPNFDSEDFVLTRASIKDEKNAPDPILWHTDKKLGTLRNIVYLKGGKKDSGQFRHMVGTHRVKHNITFDMTYEERMKYMHLTLDCKAPAGSALFFDAKCFHSNYPRINQRRIIILTWEPRKNISGGSRTFLSSNQLTDRVINNLRYFSFPELKQYPLVKDYDLNPDRPIPLQRAFSYFLQSVNFHIIIQLKIKVKAILDKLRYKPSRAASKT